MDLKLEDYIGKKCKDNRSGVEMTPVKILGCFLACTIIDDKKQPYEVLRFPDELTIVKE